MSSFTLTKRTDSPKKEGRKSRNSEVLMMDHDDMRMKIRHLHLERRMTQKQLADAMHVSCSLIGHIERGSRKPSLETLVSLSKVLNIPVDDLLS